MGSGRWVASLPERMQQAPAECAQSKAKCRLTSNHWAGRERSLASRRPDIFLRYVFPRDSFRLFQYFFQKDFKHDSKSLSSSCLSMIHKYATVLGGC